VIAPGRVTFVPQLRIGAASPGGIALPDAHPTPSQLYAPRAVWFDEERLIVADSGNHRILIWNPLPETDGAPAQVVLGQPDFFSEGPKLLQLPTGVGVFGGKLFVADAWHHRILVWNEVPARSGVLPDYALGQFDLDALEPNRGGKVSADTLYWPFGIAFVHGRFYVADTGNRRVLYWNGLPQRRQPADGVLGQPDSFENSENRGEGVGPRSFRWAHAIAGDERRLFVADAGDHRVLGWTPPPRGDAAANLVLGQPDFTSDRELNYGAQSAAKLRFPYGVSYEDGVLVVADTANNRVLLYERPPESGAGAADGVLGQPDFAAFGENEWKAITPATLCWPYGLHLHRRRLAIADSGNNRVMLWSREA
jgi:hypothetical protein